MADTPEAPAEAPKAPESVETPTTTNNNEPAPAQTSAPAPAPDMHGFTSEDLAGMRTFIDNNGGWDKIKSRISNPEPAPAPAPAQQPEAQPTNEPTSQSQSQPQQPDYRPPEGSITFQEYITKKYFEGLSQEPQYASISEQIAQGDVLKEMASFNIKPLNQDGTINDGMVRKYLNLKAQTVPAKSTGTEPNASSAPTVEYVPVEDGKVTTADQAYKILQQDAQLKAMGQSGHPNISLAEEFIKNQLNPGQKTPAK